MQTSGYAILSMAQLAETHKALADETRVRMLSLLAQLGELCVCDVETALEIPQSRASRHLTTLKHAGLVSDRRDGSWVYYRIAEDLPPPARAAVAALVEAAALEPSALRDLERAKSMRRSPCCEPVASDDGAGE